ncbi:MAG: trypsin-like serine protease, partial [Myxococcota bacterium]
MSIRLFISAAAAALLVSACHQVRLPGAPEPEPEPVDVDVAEIVEPVASESAADPAPVEMAPHLSENEDTEDIAVETAMVPLDPSAIVQVADQSAIEDLGAINAALCGLPIRPLEETPTFAERSGAKPADPNRVGTATINGVAASLYDFPGLVKMEPRAYLPSGSIATGHCSATRIAEQWFLTAAHCLDEDFDEVTLVVESETLSSPMAKRIDAIASVCHAGYSGAGARYINDIALVRVDEVDLPDLARVPIARFGATDQMIAPYNYADGKMAGWGLTSFQSELSDHLLSADLRMAAAGPAALDFLSHDGAGPCVGDSGGPVYVTESD